MNSYYGFGYKEVPKTMPKREMELLIQSLKRIRLSATMKAADFPNEWKQEMRLWRETWLLAPLDDLIERYEAALSGK